MPVAMRASRHRSITVSYAPRIAYNLHMYVCPATVCARFSAVVPTTTTTQTHPNLYICICMLYRMVYSLSYDYICIYCVESNISTQHCIFIPCIFPYFFGVFEFIWLDLENSYTNENSARQTKMAYDADALFIRQHAFGYHIHACMYVCICTVHTYVLNL
jgi:hypothetical protein